MKIERIIYANWEDDPAIIVYFAGDGTLCYVKRETKGWVEDDDAFHKAKVVDDKATWDRMFPDAGMPKLPEGFVA